MTNPKPRPALRKADDADVHPALPPKKPLKTIDSKKPKQPNPLKIGKGKATSDSIMTGKDKKVELVVKVPKSLRKRLRAEADRRGLSVDELVTILLRDRIEI